MSIILLGVDEYHFKVLLVASLLSSVADPVPFWPLDPGSEQVFSGSQIRISDPGSQTHIFTPHFCCCFGIREG